ncbi:MAG TPA: glycosyltransferase 87 family protein [Candidatus Limnocylindrales bacterium]
MIPLLIDLALYGLSAAFAGITAATSNLGPHRTWGSIAVWGYLGAAALVFVWRRRTLLTVIAWGAVAWLPMIWLAWADRAQEEVFVVEGSAGRLIETGTPYLGREELSGLTEPLLGYTPYQPGMSVFGLPHALFGDYWWTDARIYFGLVTAAALGYAASLLRHDGRLVRAIQAATVLPVCALTLATGGDDIPVLALCLLAMVLAARGRLGWAGVAIGAAAAMKLFAWPVLVVLGIFAWRRTFWVPAILIPVLAMLPSVILDARAVVENVVSFPTGHGLVTSPAASPLIGYLLAQNVPSGRTIALVLLGLAALAIGVYVLARRPRDVAAVANICAVGLLVAILLIPATRFGYLLYPVAFAFWAPCLRDRTGDGEPEVGSAQPGGDAGERVEQG